jgi:stage III sporulation protein AE
MIKNIAVICLIMLLAAVSVLPVNAQQPHYNGSNQDMKDTMDKIVKEQLDSLDMSGWDDFIKEIRSQNSIINEESAGEMIGNLLTGSSNITIPGILNEIVRILFKEMFHNLGLMAQIITIAVICGILRHMKETFENSSVGEISYFVCYIVVVILIIKSLLAILQVGREGISRMVGFMQVLFPALMALLTAVGSLASSAVMHPATALLSGVISTFLMNTMLPLILLSAIITLINQISSRVQLSRLGKLINNLCAWTLGVVFTIFIGVLTVQGIMAASFDGISVRTAKYAVDTFVPIVGGMFSQTIDTIIGCSLLLKNAIGVAGLTIIGALSFAPAIKILALMMMYKLSSALLEPISEPRISECLNSIGNTLTVLFVTVLGITVMFFMTVTLMIATGNLSVMLR